MVDQCLIRRIHRASKKQCGAVQHWICMGWRWLWGCKTVMPIAPKRACAVSGCWGYAEALGRCRDHASPILASRQAARRDEAGRAWYNTPRWRSLRVQVLKSEPLCRHCMAREGRPVPATDVDHIIAHKGDIKKFWEKRNLQPLCAACHHRKTAQERGASVANLPDCLEAKE